MKRYNWLLVLLFFGWACGSGKDPVEVVKAFSDAMGKKDFAKAKEYVSDSYISRIEYLEEKTKDHPGSSRSGLSIWKMNAMNCWRKRMEKREY